MFCTNLDLCSRLLSCFKIQWWPKCRLSAIIFFNIIFIVHMMFFLPPTKDANSHPSPNKSITHVSKQLEFGLQNPSTCCRCSWPNLGLALMCHYMSSGGVLGWRNPPKWAMKTRRGQLNNRHLLSIVIHYLLSEFQTGDFTFLSNLPAVPLNQAFKTH